MGTVAIFGGTGRLGGAIVRRIAPNSRVRFAYCSKTNEASALAADLRSKGYDVEGVRVDVCEAAAVEEFLRSAAKIDGRLSGIISANGSRFPVCPLHEVEEPDFRRIVEVDIFGTFHILKTGTRILAECGGGSVVILLTAAILRTAIFDGMSSIPKAALAGMIRQLARDAGPLNVRCNGIAPGVVDTDKVADIATLPANTRRLIETFKADTPLGRLNNPESIAALAAFLISDVAADISGQIIGADGGYSA